ncbi:AzlD domain-containing protein [Alcaligenaceae bacterium]|nr:AzlD domain-containing protein [Alcaligenaceae bacterium]
MNTSTLLWVVLFSGVGTFLIRLIPMIWQDRGSMNTARHGRLRRALDAIGPAAIVALLVVSFWDLVNVREDVVATVVPVVAGVLGVVAGKAWLKTIAWGTLAGVLAYGATVWALAKIL